MGKSTYKGYPNTHRESPALVAEVIEELKTRHNLGRIFLGGHSQGGYLALIMYMHFPEMLAGVFPMACGLVIQAEPDAFDDEELMAAQRATPLAIVHGKLDGVVPCSTGEYNYDRFEASGFPMLRFFSREVGHGYDFQPVGEAVGWLAALSTSNVDDLLKSAKQSARKSQWRDLAALLLRAMERKADTKLKKLASQLDAAAEKEADLHLQRIRKDEDGTWVDSFLPWRQQFEFAPAAKRVMAAFYELREKHDPAAEKLIEEARKRFRSGDRDGGYAKYQEIVDTYYASRRYKIVKRWLAERQ
jgi:pimeloyl-ACP methyl ester carboxylesterase